jgi:hypothetical protein
VVQGRSNSLSCRLVAVSIRDARMESGITYLITNGIIHNMHLAAEVVCVLSLETKISLLKLVACFTQQLRLFASQD